MKKIRYAALIISSLIFTACSGKVTNQDQNIKSTISPSSQGIVVTQKPGETEKPSFTKDTYPKIDGSTATIPLSETYAKELLGMSKEEAKKFVKHNKTHDAYVNLIKGNANIIFVTEPSAEELKIAKDANVELDVVPVVKEGFVFMVNTNNSVDNITSKQIQDIYQGKIKNWKEVGGADKEIISFQREKNSGSQTLMEQLVMKGLKLIEEPKTVVQGMGELIETVAKYETSEKALGYSVYYYAKTMFSKDNIKLIAIDGVSPENKSISQGKYPFTTAYYAVLKKNEPQDSSARKLLAWSLGKTAQKASESAGYVPLELR